MAANTVDEPACRLAVDSKRQNHSITSEPTSALLVDRDINKIVERKLCSKNFRALNWSLDPLDEKNGFLGEYYCLSVTVEANDKSTSLRFFAKTPPPRCSPQYDFLTRFDTFNKEIIFYTEMISRMGKGNGLKWMPECYLAKDNVIIVLDDARAEGYATPDKYVPFDKERCVWVIRALSMFHSRSLILDEKLRRDGRTLLDIYGHVLNEVLFDEEDERSQRALSSCIKGTCTLVDLAEGLKDSEKATVKERITRWARKLPTLLGPSRKFRNVLCHRDIWANNIMFKCDPQGKPIGCYLIDYQFMRYSPPAFDLVFLLNLTTDRATKEHGFESFVRIYYDSMRQQLAAEGLDVEDCFPRAAFLKSCEEARHVGLIYAICNLQVMLLKNDFIQEFLDGPVETLEKFFYGDGRPEMVTHQFRNVPYYKARLNELVLEIRDHLPDRPPCP